MAEPAPRPPRLIVLNGPPAVGKSTIAQRYADAHPLTLNLDIDRLRRLVGGWKDDPLTAGGLARAAGFAAARAHLEGGHDVVVAQYLGRVDVLDRLAELARDTGAEHHELVLTDTKDRLLARFAARTRTAAHPAHVDAQDLLERAGGVQQLEAMYDRLLLVVASRPATRLVAAREGEIEQTYANVLAALEPAPPPAPRSAPPP